MAALTTAASIPNPLYVLLEGGQYLTVANALSRVQVDVDFYDGSTYRKIVDAAMLGNAHTTVTPQPPTQSAGTSAGPTTHPAPDLTGTAAASLSVSMQANQITALAPALTPTAPVATTDSAFKVADADLIPGATKKTRSIFQFWSEAAGAGSLVAEVWADEVRGWAGAAPTNLG